MNREQKTDFGKMPFLAVLLGVSAIIVCYFLFLFVSFGFWPFSSGIVAKIWGSQNDHFCSIRSYSAVLGDFTCFGIFQLGVVLYFFFVAMCRSSNGPG